MGKQKYNTEILKEAIKKVHGDAYILDKVEYTGYKNSITLTCPEHGDFSKYNRAYFKRGRMPEMSLY